MTEAQPGNDRQPTFWCVRGHVVNDPNTQTEMIVVDAGARVQVCREHVTPVQVRYGPLARPGQAPGASTTAAVDG